MTENLLQKLEERMMTLLSEVEDLRKVVHRLMQENAAFLTEKEMHAKKLQDLISLLDAIYPTENVSNITMLAAKPVAFVQDKVEG